MRLLKERPFSGNTFLSKNCSITANFPETQNYTYFYCGANRKYSSIVLFPSVVLGSRFRLINSRNQQLFKYYNSLKVNHLLL